MGNYSVLKNAVANVIKENGNNEITGNVLQDVLLTMIANFGVNSTFAGVAVPTTNPGSPDANTFYIAAQNGIYANFDGYVIDRECVVFVNNNGAWRAIPLSIANKNSIDRIYEDVGNYITNDEYIRAYVDANDVFLWGIRTDGTIEWAKGVPQPIKEYIETKLSNIGDIDEIKNEIRVINIAITTLQGNVRRLGERITALEQNDMSQTLFFTTNEEFVLAIVDADEKLLAGIRIDGSVYFAKSEFSTILNDVRAIVDKIDFMSFDEDVEDRMEMTLDANKKIVSYRDKKGILNECVGIKSPVLSTDKLNLSRKGLTDFERILKEDGFVATHNDLSDLEYIQIPIPLSLVKINITASRFPTSKTDEIDGVLEWVDRNGNYFKKLITAIALQGSTSLGAPKKNIKFDCEDWTLKIGNWIEQDSFHLKSNYFDVFRGKSNLAYDYWRDIISYRRNNTFAKPYLPTNEYNYYNGKPNDNDFVTEPRLTPAGFPIELYYNGEYLGIFTWNIKKDRANYAMKRNVVNNIHIDPEYIAYMIDGTRVDWAGFEIRNPSPKEWTLLTMTGEKYDGDLPTELIDPTSSYYDANNVSCINSYAVKQHIINFKDKCNEVIQNNDTETFELYFDKEWFTDFFIWSNVILDGDGLARNTQYLFWGNKWYMSPYDCDQIFGNNWRGNYIYRKSARIVDATIVGNGVGIYGVFYNLYRDRVIERYAELRKSNIVSVEYIINKINDYMNHIGAYAYEREFEKWNETPCYRQPNDNPQWEYMGDYYEGSPTEWNVSVQYNVNDYVSIVVDGNTYYWRCVVANVGIRPYTDIYTETPIVGGFFDSLTRTEIWLTQRIEFLDTLFNYK